MSFDAIMLAIEQLQEYKFKPAIIYVHPKDAKKIHLDKVSYRFMQAIKRNRKLRRNGFKK